MPKSAKLLGQELYDSLRIPLVLEAQNYMVRMVFHAGRSAHWQAHFAWSWRISKAQ